MRIPLAIGGLLAANALEIDRQNNDKSGTDFLLPRFPEALQNFFHFEIYN
jgi:hypothetical protein